MRRETKDIQQMIYPASADAGATGQRGRGTNGPGLEIRKRSMLFEKMPELKVPQNYQKFWARMVRYAAK